MWIRKSGRRQLTLACYAFMLVLTGEIIFHKLRTSSHVPKVTTRLNYTHTSYTLHSYFHTPRHHSPRKLESNVGQTSTLKVKKTLNVPKASTTFRTNITVHSSGRTLVQMYLEGHRKRCEGLIVKHINDYNQKELCSCVPTTLSKLPRFLHIF